MSILTQFLFRVSFGLAAGMAVTSPRQVTSGYYRNHLYVLLGFNVLSTMVALTAPERFPLWPPLAAAIVSYIGSVCWLYEKPRPGIAALVILAGLALAGAWLAQGQTAPAVEMSEATVLQRLDPPTSGLVLGLTLAAMFLGHWYLNTPTMVLAPLKRLVLLAALAVVLRAVVAGGGAALEFQSVAFVTTERLLFLALRWLSGLIGALGLCWMAWQTLKIPNTQSATGILYVAVIATFLGELTSLLLAAEAMYPL